MSEEISPKVLEILKKVNLDRKEFVEKTTHEMIQRFAEKSKISFEDARRRWAFYRWRKKLPPDEFSRDYFERFEACKEMGIRPILFYGELAFIVSNGAD